MLADKLDQILEEVRRIAHGDRPATLRTHAAAGRTLQTGAVYRGLAELTARD